MVEREFNTRDVLTAALGLMETRRKTVRMFGDSQRAQDSYHKETESITKINHYADLEQQAAEFVEIMKFTIDRLEQYGLIEPDPLKELMINELKEKDCSTKQSN